MEKEQEQDKTPTAPEQTQTTPEKAENPLPETPPNEQNSEQSAVAETPLLEPVPFYKNKHLMVRLFIILLIIAGAVYYAYNNNVFDKSVAEVNGVKISQEEFDESLSLIEESAVLQGIDLSQPGAREELEAQALEILVNNVLLVTTAEKAGVTVSEDELNEKYEELILELGGGEELSIRMEEVGLTEEKLKENIKDRILADKYIEEVTDIENITVSNEEVAEFYAAIPGDGSELPALETVADQIKAQLFIQKQQQVVNDVLESLKSEAKIEIRM